MAIDERANQPGAAARARDDHALAQRAAALLATARVGEAAASLGVSERHLRRLFRDAIGLGPKAFARLTRFRRAIHTATQAKNPRWAEVASFAGYYDQAHLIAEFRALAGATPEAFVAELRRTAQQSPPSSGALASART
jgi:AraC-like DNA-binding protein